MIAAITKAIRNGTHAAPPPSGHVADERKHTGAEDVADDEQAAAARAP